MTRDVTAGYNARVNNMESCINPVVEIYRAAECIFGVLKRKCDLCMRYELLNDFHMSRILLEICTGDPAGVGAAIEGGADRIELCSALAEGGLTPSVAMIRFAVLRIPTNVLIRPRPGDFVYTAEELGVMKRDIEEAVRAEASGIVTGVLTPGGEVDKEACRRLLRPAGGLANTFHRAFDVAADPFRALEDIIDLGFSRLLTSGQRGSAMEGAALIAELHRRAAGRIQIIAGAGVSPVNAAQLLKASEADELHASARSRRGSAMSYTGGATMGTADAADGSRMATDSKIVSEIRRSIDSFMNSTGNE